MPDSKLKYYKTSLSDCLVTLTLMLSIFIFSGYGNIPSLFYNRKIQTELVYSSKIKPDKVTTALKEAKIISGKNIFLNSLHKNEKKFLVTFNKIIKTRLHNISSKYHSFKRADKNFQLKNIPDNSGEDTFITTG
jgi:hypothetical protein